MNFGVSFWPPAPETTYAQTLPAVSATLAVSLGATTWSRLRLELDHHQKQGTDRESCTQKKIGSGKTSG